MKNALIKYFFLLIPGLIILFSCEKTDDFSKISKDYQYQGSFSLPIGSDSMSLEVMGINLPHNDWIDSPEFLQTIDTIKLKGVIAFDFSNTFSESSRIKRLQIRMVGNNDFPTDIYISAFLADKDSIPLDTLGLKIKIDPSLVDPGTGIVSHKGPIKEYFEITSSRFQKWDSVKNIIIDIKIIKLLGLLQLYQYYNNYRLNIEMGLQVDLDFNVKPLL